MITIQLAKSIAIKHLERIQNHCSVELAFNDEHINEYDSGFVFYYNSVEYWETHDVFKSLAGNCPLFVSKVDGRLIELPTSQSVETSINEGMTEL